MDGLSTCADCNCLLHGGIALKIECEHCADLFWECIMVTFREMQLCFECFDKCRSHQPCADGIMIKEPLRQYEIPGLIEAF